MKVMERLTFSVLFCLFSAFVLNMGFNSTVFAKKFHQFPVIAEQPTPDTHTIGKSFHYMMNLVQTKSEGRIKIDVFDRAVLSGGSNTTMVQNCQNGVTHVIAVSTIPLSRFVKELEVISLPFLFTNFEQVFKFVNGPVGRELSHAIDKKGFKCLGFWPRTFRQLTNSKREIKSPDDMKGLKFRVPQIKVLTATFDRLGARVCPMPIKEVYTALQLKTVDGQENPLSSIYNWRFHEVQRYLTLWNYCADAYAVCFNRKYWDSLPKQIQNIFIKAFDKSKEYQFNVEKNETEALLKKLQEKGMIVTKLSQKQINEFKKLCEPIYKEWEGVLGKDLLKRVLEFVKQ